MVVHQKNICAHFAQHCLFGAFKEQFAAAADGRWAHILHLFG